MRTPTDEVESFNTEDTAWRFLAPWGMNADNCRLERHAVYTFQGQLSGHVEVRSAAACGGQRASDAPFAGQGMCSGVRDAANLAWKLDLVLREVAGPDLLDTYGAERSAHVQYAIGISVELGKVICITDPEQAALRDAFMIGLGADPAELPPRR